MNDLHYLAFILSGGFLFLGGIGMDSKPGMFLCVVGACILFIPIVSNLIRFVRWLFTPDSDSREEPK